MIQVFPDGGSMLDADVEIKEKTEVTKSYHIHYHHLR